LVYGPDLLVRENVVVVTINYRLSSLGFLSTGDEHAQGNYALKDIVMALKWTKDNIESFGGNSERITVFGQSAGSTAIHLLLLSNMAKGLFHQAIMQSGAGVSPFAFQTNPRERAEEIGRKIGLEFNSTESLMKQLRKVDYKKILNVERGLFNMDKPLGLRAFDFAPSLEPENSSEERFLTKNPTELMINGSSLNVPLIIGTTSNEGLLMVREYLLDEEVFDRYNNDDNFFVPLSFNLDESSPEKKKIADTFKDLYFDGQNLSSNSLNEWAKFHTDAQFKFPADRAIKSFALNTSKAIYYYDFSFDGGLNFLKTLLFLRSYQGACHAGKILEIRNFFTKVNNFFLFTDDIFYLFSPAFPIPVWPTDHSLTVRRRLIRLWTNFAKTG
jgi:bile salt-stimulated lipase